MPTNITDSNAFTDPIVGPADTDDQLAASYLVGYQGLANRTRWLYERLIARLGGPDGSGEWAYPTPRPRTTVVNLATGNAGTSGWTYNGVSGLWTSAADNGRLAFPIDLPSGAELTGIYAHVDPGTARPTTADRVRIGYAMHSVDNSLTPAPIASDIQLGDTDDGSTDYQGIGFEPGSPIAIDRSDAGTWRQYVAWLDAGNGGSPDALHALMIQWTDPGPRP